MELHHSDYSGSVPVKSTPGHETEWQDVTALPCGLQSDQIEVSYLYLAVQKGHNAIVSGKVAKLGPQVNTKRPWPCRDKFTPFHMYSVDHVYTPLHIASQYDQEEVARTLIQYGADVNLKDSQGNTALVYAIQNNNAKFVQLLLASGADVNTTCRTDTALDIASRGGFAEVVELLLEHGAEVRSAEPFNLSPLHFMSGAGRADICDRLLLKGAGVNEQSLHGQTPLHCATDNRHHTTMRVLLERGADLDVRDHRGLGALHLAAQNGDTDAVMILISAGAKFSKDNDGLDPLGTAASLGHHGVVRIMMAARAECLPDNAGLGPLHHAVESQSYTTVKLLLEAGLDVDLRDGAGRTPLHLAARRTSSAILNLLLKSGADVNRPDDRGWTALHYAVDTRNPHHVELLLKSGGDVRVRCNEGWTTLDRIQARLLPGREISGGDRLEVLSWPFDACAHEIFKHITKVKCANTHACQDLFGEIPRSSVYIEYEKICAREFQKMSETRFQNTSVCVAELLNEDINILARYSQNYDIQCVIEEERFQEHFPVYGAILASRFAAGLHRRSLLDRSLEVFLRLTTRLPVLSVECYYAILSHLQDKELTKLLFME